MSGADQSLTKVPPVFNRGRSLLRHTCHQLRHAAARGEVRVINLIPQESRNNIHPIACSTHVPKGSCRLEAVGTFCQITQVHQMGAFSKQKEKRQCGNVCKAAKTSVHTVYVVYPKLLLGSKVDCPGNIAARQKQYKYTGMSIQELAMTKAGDAEVQRLCFTWKSYKVNGKIVKRRTYSNSSKIAGGRSRYTKENAFYRSLTKWLQETALAERQLKYSIRRVSLTKGFGLINLKTTYKGDTLQDCHGEDLVPKLSNRVRTSGGDVLPSMTFDYKQGGERVLGGVPMFMNHMCPDCCTHSQGTTPETLWKQITQKWAVLLPNQEITIDYGSDCHPCDGPHCKPHLWTPINYQGHLTWKRKPAPMASRIVDPAYVE